MFTFAGKSKAVQPPAPARRTSPDHASLGHIREGNRTAHAQRGLGNQALLRLLHANAGGGGQAARSTGEMAQGPAKKTQETVPITGDGGTGGGSGGTSSGSAAPSAAAPTLKKTTVSALSTSANGGFSWGVRWSIDNATTSTNGWIVQHVVVRQNVEAWHPPLLPGATMPIVPGQGSYGGLSESWYPLWEAWQVRGGAVFVGGSTSPHSADTYGQGAVGPNTKGTTEIVGSADFYPSLTLPTAFTVKNAAPAWALPATNTDPRLTGGTGALDHNLTATWDGVGGTGATTATTV